MPIDEFKQLQRGALRSYVNYNSSSQEKSTGKKQLTFGELLSNARRAVAFGSTQLGLREACNGGGGRAIDEFKQLQIGAFISHVNYKSSTQETSTEKKQPVANCSQTPGERLPSVVPSWSLEMLAMEGEAERLGV